MPVFSIKDTDCSLSNGKYIFEPESPVKFNKAQLLDFDISNNLFEINSTNDAISLRWPGYINSKTSRYIPHGIFNLTELLNHVDQAYTSLGAYNYGTVRLELDDATGRIRWRVLPTNKNITIYLEGPLLLLGASYGSITRYHYHSASLFTGVFPNSISPNYGTSPGCKIVIDELGGHVYQSDDVCTFFPLADAMSNNNVWGNNRRLINSSIKHQDIKYDSDISITQLTIKLPGFNSVYLPDITWSLVLRLN
jgi:hypothetical protein